MRLARNEPANVVYFATFRRPRGAGIRRLIRDIICGLAEDIRGSLPDDERTAGAFVSGMAWGLLLFMLTLVGVTWLWAVTR